MSGIERMGGPAPVCCRAAADALDISDHDQEAGRRVMPDDEPDKVEKTLEMRVAELEDKLAQVHITEDEMAAFHKVSGLLGGAAAQQQVANPAAGCVTDCVSGCINECAIRQCVVHQCIVSQCIIRQCIIRHCIVSNPIISNPIIQQCNECFECGPGQPGAGTIGGFSSFGR